MGAGASAEGAQSPEDRVRAAARTAGTLGELRGDPRDRLPPLPIAQAQPPPPQTGATSALDELMQPTPRPPPTGQPTPRDAPGPTPRQAPGRGAATPSTAASTSQTGATPAKPADILPSIHKPERAEPLSELTNLDGKKRGRAQAASEEPRTQAEKREERKGATLRDELRREKRDAKPKDRADRADRAERADRKDRAERKDRKERKQGRTSPAKLLKEVEPLEAAPLGSTLERAKTETANEALEVDLLLGPFVALRDARKQQEAEDSSEDDEPKEVKEGKQQAKCAFLSRGQELSLQPGDMVTVTDKKPGFVFCSRGAKQGWVPELCFAAKQSLTFSYVHTRCVPPLERATQQAFVEHYRKRLPEDRVTGSSAEQAAEAIFQLIARGYALSSSSSRHGTPCHVACVQGSVEAVSVFTRDLPDQVLDALEQHSFTPLHIAALQGHDQVMDALLEVVDVSQPLGCLLERVTPLHYAATSTSDGSRQLLELRADPQVRLEHGPPLEPLSFAVAFGQRETVGLLLKHGARPSGGALRLAALIGEVEIGMQLVAAGADPWQVDKQGKSALALCASKSLELRQAWLEAKALPRAQKLAQKWLDAREEPASPRSIGSLQDTLWEQEQDTGWDAFDVAPPVAAESPEDAERRLALERQEQEREQERLRLLEEKLSLQEALRQQATVVADHAEELRLERLKAANLKKLTEQLQALRTDTQAEHAEHAADLLSGHVAEKEQLERRVSELVQLVESCKQEARQQKKEHEEQLRIQEQRAEELEYRLQEQRELADKREKDLQRASKLRAAAYQARVDRAEQHAEELVHRATPSPEAPADRSPEASNHAEEQALQYASDGVLEAKYADLEEKQRALAARLAEEQRLRRKALNDLLDFKGAIRVLCRLRPLLDKEKSELVSVSKSDDFSVQVRQLKRGQQDTKGFVFDSVFDPQASQQEVFQECEDACAAVLDGYNVTIFAYGQTGAGKTHTMYGGSEDPGLAPRALERLFQVVDRDRQRSFKFQVKASMLELYRDDLVDVLMPPRQRDRVRLEVKKDPKTGLVSVLNATERLCESWGQLEQVLTDGLHARHVASTKMNSDSSRSHLVLQVSVVKTNEQTGLVSSGKLSLVDLAGSERIARSGVQGDELKEAIAINKSLTALGDVIEVLSKAKRSKGTAVPYRNHKLTMLLSDALGGSAKALMFVNVAPGSSNVHETLCSLQYASRVKEVTNAPALPDVEVHEPQQPNLLAVVEEEMDKLKADLGERAVENTALHDSLKKLKQRYEQLKLEKQRGESLANEAILTLKSELEETRIQVGKFRQLRKRDQAELEQVGQLRKDLDGARRNEALHQQRQQELLLAQEDHARMLDLYKKEQVLRKRYHNKILEMKGAIRVLCRTRPPLQREQHDAIVATKSDEFTLALSRDRNGVKEQRSFQFDSVFGPEASQADVFADCADLVQSALDGYNVTIFAYGQTGAGKTHTMYGSANDPGLAPRTVDELFRLMQRDKDRKLEYETTVYMVELYREDLVDLLQKKEGKEAPPLQIKKDPRGTVFIQNVVEVPVANRTELLATMADGLNRRHVACTKMNSDSSRSHLLLSILVRGRDTATGRRSLGKVTLVDLAGSERTKKSGAEGAHMKEAIAINKSLTALGDVIEALTSGSKNIPYRNHKLTQLMSDSLGGNAKTLMFVNVSPAASNTGETLSALIYATRAKQVTNEAARSEESAEIVRLKQVITMLSKQLKDRAEDGDARHDVVLGK